MARFVCLQCAADIHPDLVETTGAAVCPFCSADLSELGLPQSESADISVEPESSLFDAAGDRVTRTFPHLPAKSRIKVVEASDERLVMYLPGGGKQATGLGCLAAMWLGFMCLFTPPSFLPVFQGPGNNAPPTLFLIGFLALFWTIGLAMAWFWMKMKYERTFVLLEPQRLVVQKVLFNRKRIVETTLVPDSWADLVEAYQQNDVPVYRIEVRGQDRPAKFGTALADDEKDWIVDRINEFLQVATVPVVTPASAESSETRVGAAAAVRESCRQCGAPLTSPVVSGALTCGHCGAVSRVEFPVPAKAGAVSIYERLDPTDISADSAIHIDENSTDVLEFSYPAAAQSPVRWIAPLFALTFSLVWYGGIISFLADVWQAPFLAVRILFTLFLIPFLIAGLLPLAMGLVAFRGRTSVRVSADRLECRWYVGWFKYSRSIEAAAVRSVGIESAVKSAQNPRVRGSPGAALGGPQNCCVARAGNKKLYLTMFQEELVARQVASLVCTRLEQLGHALRDA